MVASGSRSSTHSSRTLPTMSHNCRCSTSNTFFTWRVYCSWGAGSSNITSQCNNWNQDPASGNTGMIIRVDNTICFTTGYACADTAAGNMLDCLTQQIGTGAECSFTGDSFVNSSFPNIRTYVTSKDGSGRIGTLQNAFCDAMTAFTPCSKH